MAISFGDISQIMRESRQVDDTILALAKLENRRELDDHDRASLAFARDFLREAKSGSTWLADDEDKQLDTNTTRYFSSLVRAADSMSSARTLDKFTSDIDTLLDAANALLDGREIAITTLQQLRKFFGRVLNSELDQVDGMFTPIPFPHPGVA